jgi:hypothetical protein
VLGLVNLVLWPCLWRVILMGVFWLNQKLGIGFVGM